MCYTPDVPNQTPVEVQTEKSTDDLTLGTDVPTAARESARESLAKNRQTGAAQPTAR